jgi:hypothetical protein
VPCHRCGARQTDPARGASPWKRGVRGGVQVLVCPTCQERSDWKADLDRCQGCGSTMLVRLLGETHCRACGDSRPESAAAGRGKVARDGPSADHSAACSLAEEVGAALDRFFGRA